MDQSQLADVLTKLRGDGDLLRAACRRGTIVIVEAPETLAMRKQEHAERLLRVGRRQKAAG